MPKRKAPSSPAPTGHSPIRRKVDMATKLTFVPQDSFDDDTHVRLDESVMEYNEAEPSSVQAAAAVLATIVEFSEQKLNPQYSKFHHARDLVKEHPGLMDMLKVAWQEKSFRNIRRLQILHSGDDKLKFMATASIEPTQNQQDAVEASWHREFVGSAAEALWHHMKMHSSSENLNVYAHYTSIVQSSGMGKSRTIDELSKSRFIIPLNLRERGTTGYPPADDEVRDYLTPALSQAVAYNRMCAFLEALFQHTGETIQKFDHSELEHLPATFRRKMTERQTYTSVNDFRKNFYAAVIQKAKIREGQQQLQSRDQPPIYNTPSKKGKQDKHDFAPAQACEELITVIRSLRAQRQGTPTPGEDDEGPEVILAFDEAHTMATPIKTVANPMEIPVSSSNFNELRKVLRSLNKFPIFSLFCSTTGKISLFTPAPGYDKSKRVLLRQLILIEPFTELPFDALAEKVQLGKKLKLEMVTSDAHIVRLGRPMFATMYEAGDKAVKEDIIQLAAAKLLNSDQSDIGQLSDDQRLACLSHRLPIEFASTTYIDHETEQRQVEGHMRICLKIDATLESMVTVSASEPILSEAAYTIMSRPSFNVPDAMKLVLDGFSVNKGDRGEFLVMLMFTIARDKAVGPPNIHGSPKSRILDVPTFLTPNLFRGHSALKHIATDFAYSRMYFNHYIKVHEHAVIDAESLLLLSTRGAAVLCANNQRAIDGIHPFLVKGTTLVRSNLGLILWQSKNDASFTATPQQELFTAMNPYRVKILEENEVAVPLIKIVFALAAKKSSLNVIRRPASAEYNAVVYEIWCAGMLPETLGVIDPSQATTWEALLQASYGWKSIYKTRDGYSEIRRTRNPGAARDSGHWDMWCKR